MICFLQCLNNSFTSLWCRMSKPKRVVVVVIQAVQFVDVCGDISVFQGVPVSSTNFLSFTEHNLILSSILFCRCFLMTFRHCHQSPSVCLSLYFQTLSPISLSLSLSLFIKADNQIQAEKQNTAEA